MSVPTSNMGSSFSTAAASYNSVICDSTKEETQTDKKMGQVGTSITQKKSQDPTTVLNGERISIQQAKNEAEAKAMERRIREEVILNPVRRAFLGI